MLNVTSIRGSPRLAGRIPSSLKCPNILLSLAIERSPWKTKISTAGWLSSAVEKIWLFVVGIVVLRVISGVITPPIVSIPNVNGVTSSKTTSLTSPRITPPWTAAPIETASSGLTDIFGCLPSKLLTNS